MEIVIGWLVISVATYIHATSVVWTNVGDVLGFKRSDRAFALIMSLGGPITLLGGLLAGLQVFGLRGAFPSLTLLWSPRPPRNELFRDRWSPE